MSRTPFSSLNASLEQRRKATEDGTAAAQLSGVDDKQPLSQNRTKSALPSEDFVSESPWGCGEALYIRVSQLLRDLITELPDPVEDHIRMQSDEAAREAAAREAATLPKLQERFAQCERAYARLAAIEREILYPLAQRAISEHKLDESLGLTVDLLLQDHNYFDAVFSTLGKSYRNPYIITSLAFKQALQALVEALNIHHERENGAFNVVEQYYDLKTRQAVRTKMMEIYQAVPQTPFTQYGSIAGKVSDALTKMSSFLTGNPAK